MLVVTEKILSAYLKKPYKSTLRHITRMVGNSFYLSLCPMYAQYIYVHMLHI